MRAVQLTAYGDLSNVLSMSTFPCPRLRVRKNSSARSRIVCLTSETAAL